MSAAKGIHPIIYFGRNILKEALAARITISEIFVDTKPAYEYVRKLPGFDVSKYKFTEGLPKEVQKEVHQGVAFRAKHDFYEAYSPDHLKSFSFIILCNHIEDIFNLGSIARAAAGFGAGLIIHEDKKSASLTAAAIKSSAGCAFHLKFMRVPDLVPLAKILKNSNYQVIGLELSEAAIPLFEWKPEVPLALVLGSEGSGIDTALRNCCTQFIKIPLKLGIDSLNVSHAAAIAMSWAAEARRNISKTV